MKITVIEHVQEEGTEKVCATKGETISFDQILEALMKHHFITKFDIDFAEVITDESFDTLGRFIRFEIINTTISVKITVIDLETSI